jgi:pimeloyl-ACP methyl ester carboxylesterase
VSATGRRRKQYFIRAARPARLRAGRDADAEYGQPGEPSWRTIDWAAHSRRLEVNGKAVNVVEYGGGEGPPVVFIHGLAGCWQNWLENLPAIGEHRRVVTLDLPGFGDSEMPDGDISITGYAETVESVCEQLDLGPVAVVGNSMGGFTAAELAIRHPDRVERLVLVDAAGISIADLHRQPILTLVRLLAVNASSPARERATLLRPRARHLAFRAVMRHPTRMPLDLLAAQGTGTAKPGFVLAMDALISYDFRERLGEIACPTLIVHGREDGLVPMADAEEFERLISKSRILLLDDTGHVPMMERPLTFNRELLAFLTADDA